MSNNTLTESNDGGGGGGCNSAGRSIAAANGGHDRTNDAGGGVIGNGNSGYAGELDEILRCAVCLDRMTDPRILPCQHTFCASPCLEGLIDASRVLRCPECRERYLAPPGGVRQLPSNRLITNLLELAAASATTGEGHQTTEVDGNSPRDATATSSRRCRMCRRDDVSTLAVCVHCKKQICSECRAAHARQLHHDCSLLIGRVRRQLPGITDTLAEVNAAALTVRANADALRTEVGSLFERLVARFRAREANLLDELRVREEDQLRKLRVLRTEHESAIERATEFCDMIERRLRASIGEGQSNGSGLGAGGFGGDEPSEADVVACHKQCIDHLEDLERFDGRDRGELRARILRFNRSRCLDLVEACDVGAFVSVDSFPDNSTPDSSSAALNSSESLVREFLQPSPPSHLTGFSSNTVQEHQLAAQEAATAAVTTAARGHIGSNGLVDELSLLLHSVRPDDGAGTTSSDSLLDGLSLLQRLSQPQLPMQLLPLPLPPPPDHSLPDLAVFGSPLAAVHNALLDYMRATRPFVSSPLLADAQSADAQGLQFERPDVDGHGEGDANNHDNDAVHTDALPSRRLGRVADASGSTIGDNSLSYQDVTFPSVSGAESVLNESSATLSRPPGFLSVPLRGGLGPASSSSSAIDYQRKVLPSFKIGISRGTEVGSLTWPRGVAASPVNDTIVVADSGNQRVQVFDRQGRFVHAFGAYGQGDGQFDTPTGVAVTGGGHIVVSDRYNGRLLVFDAYGDFVRRIGGGSGSAPGQLSQPWGVACDRSDGSNEGRVYVCDKGNHRVQVFGLASGELLGAFGRLGDRDGELNGPSYACVSTNGERVVVSDSGNNRVQLFTADGEFISVIGSGEGSSAGQLRRPRGVAIDERGFVVVADSGNNRVQVFRPDGSLHWVFGSWGHGDGSMKGVEGVALNSCGQIVVVDRDNHRVQVF